FPLVKGFFADLHLHRSDLGVLLILPFVALLSKNVAPLHFVSNRSSAEFRPTRPIWLSQTPGEKSASRWPRSARSFPSLTPPLCALIHTDGWCRSTRPSDIWNRQRSSSDERQEHHDQGARRRNVQRLPSDACVKLGSGDFGAPGDFRRQRPYPLGRRPLGRRRIRRARARSVLAPETRRRSRLQPRRRQNRARAWRPLRYRS